MALMNRRLVSRSRAVLGLALAATAAGCDNFLEVKQPTVMDASNVEAASNLAMLSQSAQGNLFNAVDNVVVYGAWFSGEAYVDDSTPQRTDIGRRDAVENNSLLN